MRPPPSRRGSASRVFLLLVYTGRPVWTSADLTSATVQPGWRWRSSAAPPATCGAAMLVPSQESQPPGTEERMFTPGALTSGLNRSEIGVGPDEENDAITRRFVVAAVVMAFGALPGEVIETRPNSL